MATINLAPSTDSIVAARRRQRLLFMSAGVLIVILVIAWAILFGLKAQASRANTDRESRLKTIETEIAELDETAERIILFEQRLSAMDRLLKNQISWDPLLRELERLLLAQTTLHQARMEQAEGKLVINGVTPNLDELAQVMASLRTREGRPTLFQDVELTQSDRREEKVNGQVVSVQYTFALEVHFDPDKLKINN